MIRVFAKKAFIFRRYERKDGLQKVAEEARTSPMEICDLPDWVKQDRMFDWASGDGDLQEMATKKDERRVVQEAVDSKSRGNKARSEKLLGNA